MTRLEKMLSNTCLKPCDIELDYDPREGHYHVSPPPPECWDNVTFADTPAEIYVGDDCYNIQDLQELRDWLCSVLQEVTEDTVFEMGKKERGT